MSQVNIPTMPRKATQELLLAWLEENMPGAFYEEVNQQERELIASALVSFKWQRGFATLESATHAYCLCLNHDEADLRVLERFKEYEIRDYRTFVSTAKFTLMGYDERLRIIVFTFLEGEHKTKGNELEQAVRNRLWGKLRQQHPQVEPSQFEVLLSRISPDFVKLLNEETLSLALDLLVRPSLDEFIEVQALPDYQWQASQRPSLQIVLSVSLVRLNPYLYQLAKLIKRHGLFLRRINATHIAPFEPDGRLLIVIAVHGKDHRPAWDVTPIPELVHELSMLRLSPTNDLIEQALVDTGYIKAYQSHVIRSAAIFCHQMLASFESDVYTYNNCLEALCRHAELTKRLAELFEKRFHPTEHNIADYDRLLGELKESIYKLDTGHPYLDRRRRCVLMLAADWIDCTLRTNFWRQDKLGVCYRVDPQIMKRLTYSVQEKFPELPYAIFFHYGFGTFGFHIRFRDLARGGLRSVLPRTVEQYQNEQNGLFQEAYNLALTQQKKNKDIPEGGAKAVILCSPYTMSSSEKLALRSSWLNQGVQPELIEQKLNTLEKQRQLAYLYQSQKAFIESLLVLVNCHEDGTLKAKRIVDYYKQPAYLFLGPDENMHNNMLIWIDQFSRKHQYRSAGAFISSHPTYGINHKQYGVTSFGVHTYLKEALKYVGIDPYKNQFRVKISGGPDGDVAGNQILNLARDFPHTAKLVALTDVSGTIFDPQGLEFSELIKLFEQGLPIHAYPHQCLHEGAFLLDRTQVQTTDSLSQKTLLWRREKGQAQAQAHWISSSEANLLFRQNLHQTPAEVFIPAGGRPRALSLSNIDEFLMAGEPTARIIVEGANLYLTQEAREFLEKRGVLIFRDSTANKGGVMSSSLEVLMRLVLEPEEIIACKPKLVEAILQTIEAKALAEARLLLREHHQTRRPLSLLSQDISEQINLFSDQLREELEHYIISQDPGDSFNRVILNYCPPYLRENYANRVLERLPIPYKRAIVATHIACQLVYGRGLSWRPTLASILPILLNDSDLTGSFPTTFATSDTQLSIAN